VESLSALDAEFLHLEDDVTTLHIGGVATFAGPMPSYDDFVAMLESKLHAIPRYRQRVERVPLELGRPVWVDDPHFSARNHIFHTALPSPGDDAALCRLVGRLMSHRLDRSRPLWETWMVEGLGEDGWALIFKVHHAMVDGVAGVALLGAVLDVEPVTEIADPRPWEPAPAPSSVERVTSAWRGLAADVGDLLGAVPGAVARPDRTLRSAGEAVRGLMGFGRHVAPTAPLSIEGPIGPHRSWAHAEVSLADVKAIREAFGGTVNDVVQAAITAGFRDLLADLGDDPDQAVVRTGVPVSVRRDDGSGVPDNRVSTLLVELPVHLTDPLERYAVVQERLAEAKASHMSEVGETLTHLADLAPPMAVEMASKAALWASHQVTQRSVNTVTTNVPGPQFPLYCLGRQMQDYLPYVPIADGVRVGIAILSYDGTISFGVSADQGSVPDPGPLARGSAAGVAELLALARPRSKQAKSSASAPSRSRPKKQESGS
jgi:WS/DGAT/MGAT family acyltransferase